MSTEDAGGGKNRPLICFEAASGLHYITAPFLTPHSPPALIYANGDKKNKGREKRKLKMPVTVADERERVN